MLASWGLQVTKLAEVNDGGSGWLHECSVSECMSEWRAWK
jgi:hypothetical protein